MTGKSRFSEVFSKAAVRLENQPLWRKDHSVVVPTLGMMVPNWFLIVPEIHTFNYAQQTSTARGEVPILVRQIWDELAADGQDLLVFEHGAQEPGSAVGCGLDHAHVHVLLGASAFIDAVWTAMSADLGVSVEQVGLDHLHDRVASDQPYYLAWRGGDRLLEQPVHQESSQRFRRIIAKAAGISDHWHYETHPFHDNITRTVEAVRRRRLLAA
jgi:ATP adenylyltransferase